MTWITNKFHSSRMNIMRLTLVVLCIYVLSGCKHRQVVPEYGVAVRVIEKMPYATAPDLCVELSRKW